MVIDMHTHIWPDQIAKKTVESLQALARIPSYTDGTLSSLKASMNVSGVELSVVQPVVTKPEQFETINQVAAKICKEKNIVSFGGIHPKNTEYIKKLDWIKSLGLKGIKIHPDYQKTYIDSEEYSRIIEYALKIGLIVTTHAGVDVGLPTPVHCSPERVLRLYQRLQLEDKVDNFLILAHTGGCDQWEEVLKSLAGKKLYFDLSFTKGRISEELFLEIVHKHGSKRLLFGTDSPWASQKESIEWIQSLPLTKQEKEDILYKNAKRLLQMEV